MFFAERRKSSSLCAHHVTRSVFEWWGRSMIINGGRVELASGVENVRRHLQLDIERALCIALFNSFLIGAYCHDIIFNIVLYIYVRYLYFVSNFSYTVSVSSVKYLRI